MYIRNGAWGIISGFGNVEKNSEEDERGAAGECVSRQLLFFFRWKRQMGQRMNEENQEQDQKDEIAGKQEEPGQIVSEKVEKKREEKPKKKRLRIQGAAWRRLDNTASSLRRCRGGFKQCIPDLGGSERKSRSGAFAKGACADTSGV